MKKAFVPQLLILAIKLFLLQKSYLKEKFFSSLIIVSSADGAVSEAGTIFRDKLDRAGVTFQNL